MKKFLFFILLLTSCAMEVIEEDSINTTTANTEKEVFPPSNSDEVSMCLEEQVFILETPEGESIEIEVPIMCEEFFIDKGDPPSDLIYEEKIFSDPFFNGYIQ